jgi:hypothetical protein
MSNLRTAAQQALEALEGGRDSWRLIGPAIDALRAALEQPERAQAMRDAGYTRRPTLREMAEPVQDTAFDHWWDNALDGPTPMAPVSKETAQWIWNAALAEPQEPVQKPVAWRWRLRSPTDAPGFAQPWNVTTYYPREQANEIEPLYTHPPRREWQELSNGEIYTAYITATNQTLRPQDERLALAFARAIEAALKKRNA